MDCADYCISSNSYSDCAGRYQLHGIVMRQSEGPVKVPRFVLFATSFWAKNGVCHKFKMLIFTTNRSTTMWASRAWIVRVWTPLLSLTLSSRIA